MKIYFVEVESLERQFFESELGDHELYLSPALRKLKGTRKSSRLLFTRELTGYFSIGIPL